VQILSPYTRIIKADETQAHEAAAAAEGLTPEEALAATQAKAAEAAKKKGPVRIRKADMLGKDDSPF
jgi:myo-inositol-1(or 4)-monophosphatase